MPPPWLAVGAETDPLARARQLQGSWERLLAEGVLDTEPSPDATAGLRPTIVESWRRSLATGLDPTGLVVPIEADHSAVQERWLEHPLGSFAHVLEAQLGAIAEESRSLVVVSDASGLLLHIDGADWLRERAREMNFVEGARLSEAVDGTNGIGTPLAADHPLQVFAFEHFNQTHHQWICSGAPVHDPLSGRIIGLIDLSSIWKIAHPRSLELVTVAARTMERCLLDDRRDQDARLRRRYSDLMTRSTDLLVNRLGYVLDGDKPRQPTPIDFPESGGEIILDDGSLAVAEPLGQGEAYLVRRPSSRGAKSASVEGLEHAEERARELASEQAALRRVATLVARESSPDQLFAVVAEQGARMFGVPLVRLVRYDPDGSVVVGGFGESSDDSFPVGSRWPLDTRGVVASVRQSGRSARVAGYARKPAEAPAVLRLSGMRSAVASPMVVEGRLWGAMVIASPRREPLPEHTEARLTDFTELVATAIANAESRSALGRIAEEQAALRRVATLVAKGASPDEVFSVVSNEVGRLFGSDQGAVARYDPDGSGMVYVGVSQGARGISIGTRWPLEDYLASTTVYRTGSSARMDRIDMETASGPLADMLREIPLVSRVAAPVVVEGALWGVITVSDMRERLPPDTEERMTKFTELVATAIANAESRAELAASEERALELAKEQTALRRIATLVAKDAKPDEVFSAVSREIEDLLGIEIVTICRHESDGFLLLSSRGMPGFPAGMRLPLDVPSLPAFIYRAGEPVRIDDFTNAEGLNAAARDAGVRAAVGVPIAVGGTAWGSMCAASTMSEPFPADTEERLARFTDLVATSVSNAIMREELAESETRAQDLAREQAALRRVATLVARGAAPSEVFAAVSREIGRLLGSDQVAIMRYVSGGSEFVVVGGTDGLPEISRERRWPLDDVLASAEVYRTSRPARRDHGGRSSAPGPLDDLFSLMRPKSTVATPIVVEGQLWGCVTVSTDHEPLPPDAEERAGKFTELVATAIANADSREELAASRARVIAAADDARRRIERNLHDGAQQRLVTLAVALRRAESKVPSGSDELRADVGRVGEGLIAAVDELRELSQGIHPAELTEGGLSPALKALGRRCPIRVELDVPFEQRLPDQVEVGAYYTVSEALTNASKHSGGTRVWVSLHLDDDVLGLSIRDDGVGGADASLGSGLTGLRDRIEALGGTFRIESPRGGGTRIEVEIPIRQSAEQREPAP